MAHIYDSFDSSPLKLLLLMKFIFAFIITIILSWAISLYPDFLPWWSFVICCFIVSVLIKQKPFMAWLSAFLAIAILWTSVATFLDMQNQHHLSHRIALILPLHGSFVLLIIITGLLGGILGGFASLTGAYLVRK